MSARLAVTIDERLLAQLDQLVGRGAFASRSAAVEAALRERLARTNRRRLARECAKMDPLVERTLAEEGMAEDFATWPAY